MTADDAGVTVRERLARVLMDVLDDQQENTAYAYVVDCNPVEQLLSAANFRVADALLAAGFGDVAEAKADLRRELLAEAQNMRRIGRIHSGHILPSERDLYITSPIAGLMYGNAGDGLIEWLGATDTTGASE